MVAGARHDFGRGGRLLVCDGTGFYEVLNRREVHHLELPKSGAGHGSEACLHHLHVLFMPARLAALVPW